MTISGNDIRRNDNEAETICQEKEKRQKRNPQQYENDINQRIDMEQTTSNARKTVTVNQITT